MPSSANVFIVVVDASISAGTGKAIPGKGPEMVGRAYSRAVPGNSRVTAREYSRPTAWTRSKASLPEFSGSMCEALLGRILCPAVSSLGGRKGRRRIAAVRICAVDQIPHGFSEMVIVEFAFALRSTRLPEGWNSTLTSASFRDPNPKCRSVGAIE